MAYCHLRQHAAQRIGRDAVPPKSTESAPTLRERILPQIDVLHRHERLEYRHARLETEATFQIRERLPTAVGRSGGAIDIVELQQSIGRVSVKFAAGQCRVVAETVIHEKVAAQLAAVDARIVAGNYRAYSCRRIHRRNRTGGNRRTNVPSRPPCPPCRSSRPEHFHRAAPIRLARNQVPSHWRGCSCRRTIVATGLAVRTATHQCYRSAAATLVVGHRHSSARGTRRHRPSGRPRALRPCRCETRRGRGRAVARPRCSWPGSGRSTGPGTPDSGSSRSAVAPGRPASHPRWPLPRR